MKLSYKSAGDAGSFTLLADEADRVTTLELAAPSFSRQAQVEPLIRSESAATFDRQNVTGNLPITATITYASRAFALASVGAMAVLFAGRVHLKLEQNATSLYFPNAVLNGYTPELTGVTVRHSFQFTTQQVTTEEPS